MACNLIQRRTRRADKADGAAAAAAGNELKGRERETERTRSVRDTEEKPSLMWFDKDGLRFTWSSALPVAWRV